MNKLILTAACGLWAAFAAPVLAQTEPVVVVELFTSQGCSSCPPADQFLGELSKDPSVIALALHVDYWDYLGWKDKFASEQFSKRQRAYAQANRDRMVYTPQMIVAGAERIVGNSKGDVRAAIAAHLAKQASVSLSLERAKGMVTIRAAAVGSVPGRMLVQVVRYNPSQVIDITRGENTGKTITYHNIVTSWNRVAEWDGAQPLMMVTEAKGAEPVVVIVQSEGPAEILAAARLR